MTFMERARVFYQRGDVVRAAFVLAEGLKREAWHEDALNWFLQIYVEEVEGPGLEQELIRVLEKQHDGAELLGGVREELRRLGQDERLAFLDRVNGLRRRAAEVRAESEGPPADAASPDEDIDGIDPVLAQGIQRRRRGGARAAVEALPALVEAADAAQDEAGGPVAPRRRARRRRPRAETGETAQGVLPLDAAARAPRDSWRGFKGVAAHLDPEAVPPLPVTVDTSAAEVGEGGDEAPPRRRAASVRIGGRGERGSERAAVRRTPPRVATASAGQAAPEAADEPAPDAGPVRRTRPAIDQLLSLDGDDAWSFGETVGAKSLSASAESPPVRVRGRLRRPRRVPGVRAAAAGLAAAGRGLAWLAGGRRGISLLALVLVLGAVGLGYRACSGIVASQLAEAEHALARGDGPGLQRAVTLYADRAGGDVQAAERLAFARALLVIDYGQTPPAGTPDAASSQDAAQTVYGASARALSLLAQGNLALARPEAESVVERFGSDWLAYWTRGRVAVGDGAWDRAEAAYTRAHQLDGAAVLPVLGLIDLALRSGRDERVEDLLATLQHLRPDHPDLPVVQGLLHVGLDPLDTRAAPARLDLPDPAQHLLSLRTREWIAYLRAREALSAWQLDAVAQALMGLRHAQEGPLGVRVNLLEAALAARRYRLQDATAAIQRARAAAPDRSPAAAEARHLEATIDADLGRPDLALQALGDGDDEPVLRARLLVEAGHEEDALRALGALIERPDTQASALRMLVDYHLRRGVPDRAHMRADGLRGAGDQAYAAARLAEADLDWSQVRDHADEALRASPSDIDSLRLWARATAELGQAEHALERIDERAARSVLVGTFDEIRLEVLLASGRAPRETLADFVGLLQTSEPTGMSRLAVLARAYEAIGDADRATQAAQQVLAGEPNNGAMHALLGRLYHTTGQQEESNRHLRAYLALAPQTEPTDWARTMLAE